MLWEYSCDIFIIYDKLYSLLCVRTVLRSTPRDECHTEAASMRDNWMTGPRERGISRETRIAFLATRSVTPYGRIQYICIYIYRVLLIRLDKPQERIAYGKIGKKKGVVLIYIWKYLLFPSAQRIVSFNRRYRYSKRIYYFADVFLTFIETFAIDIYL